MITYNQVQPLAPPRVCVLQYLVHEQQKIGELRHVSQLRRVARTRARVCVCVRVHMCVQYLVHEQKEVSKLRHVSQLRRAAQQPARQLHQRVAAAR